MLDELMLRLALHKFNIARATAALVTFTVLALTFMAGIKFAMSM